MFSPSSRRLTFGSCSRSVLSQHRFSLPDTKQETGEARLRQQISESVLCSVLQVYRSRRDSHGLCKTSIVLRSRWCRFGGAAMQRSLVQRFDTCRLCRLSWAAIALTTVLFGCTLHASAQQTSTDTQAWSDTNLPKPTSSGHPAGYADPAAMQELQAYDKATGGANWTGMKATGTMTETGATGPEQARLFMLSGNRMRLEVNTPTGEDRTVIKGSHGDRKSVV